MSIRSLPGHVFMHVHQINWRFRTGEERARYLRLFDVAEGDDVYLYSGHSDLDNGCLMRFGELLQDVRPRRGAADIGRQLAGEIAPLIDVLRQARANPMLYGCLCHDDIKKAMALELGITYVRCSACGGNEGEVVVQQSRRVV